MNSTNEEIWASLEELGYPNYVVNNFGEIRNLLRGSYVSISSTQAGIAKVGLYKPNSNHQDWKALAPLVALAFIPVETERFDTPICLDGDRMNCAVTNLMWRPKWFAVKYHQQFYNDLPGWDGPLVEINSGEEFPDSWHAATKYGLLDRDILLGVLNDTPVFPYGYHFKRLDQAIPEQSNRSRRNRGL